MVDLHLHTTASDGGLAPAELVRRASAAGLRTVAVTDHDTMAGVPEASHEAASLGMTLIAGIEITAVDDGCDVHVLGYFLAADAPELVLLMKEQRQERVDRAREILQRLAGAGAPVDADEPLAALLNQPSRTVARPQVAQALVRAGHVASIAEAFDKFLSAGRPAYVPHKGPHPTRVVEVINGSGGIASLAHPGPLGRDYLIPALVESGLAAIEAYHSEHDATAQRRYVALARDYGLAVSGGSDYHGNGRPRDAFFGKIALPVEEFERLVERATHVKV